jgi:hypothetical protein
MNLVDGQPCAPDPPQSTTRRGVFDGARRALLFVVLAAPVLVPLHLLADGILVVVDHKIAADGTELAVTQTPDDSVRLNVRRPGEPWSEYFLESDDALWVGEIQLLPGETKATILNYGREVARLDWRQRRFFRASWAPLGSSIGDPIPPIGDIDNPFLPVAQRTSARAQRCQE